MTYGLSIWPVSSRSVGRTHGKISDSDLEGRGISRLFAEGASGFQSRALWFAAVIPPSLAVQSSSFCHLCADR